jgi:hypothetical protein
VAHHQLAVVVRVAEQHLAALGALEPELGVVVQVKPMPPWICTAWIAVWT